MIKDIFALPFYHGKVKAHKETKKIVLERAEAIKDDPNCQLESPTERVLSDFRLGNDPAGKQYKDAVIAAVTPNIREFAEMVGGKQFQMGQIWMQNYERHCFHNSHHHWPALYSLVYYVRFDPKKHLGTTFHHPSRLQTVVYQIRNLKSETIFQPKVKEGDMVIFPSFIDHNVPMNESDSPRTIVAFNFDMVGGEETRSIPRALQY